MPQAIYRDHGDEIRVAAAAGALADGDVVQIAGLAGVVEGPVVLGDPYNVRIKGQWDVASASATTFAIGAVVEWDDTNNLAVASGAGDFVLGNAAKAKISGETVVRVIFNESTVAPA
jgi:predicted RecA/RadA family phage recombinase